MSTKWAVMLLLSVAGLAIVTLVFAGQQPQPEAPRMPELRNGIVPIGSLGRPLGSYLTIEGTRVEGSKAGIRTLRVDTVNGRKLREPAGLWIENVGLPEGKRCILKGYEDCRMIGQPPAVAAARKGDIANY